MPFQGAGDLLFWDRHRGIWFRVHHRVQGPPFTLPLLTVDLAASSITLAPFTAINFGPGVAATFGDLDSSLGDIVGVNVTTSGLSGIDASDLAFTAQSVTIDLSNSNWPSGGSAAISLLFGNAAAVPLPATLVLVGAGLVGVGAWRRGVAA